MAELMKNLWDVRQLHNIKGYLSPHCGHSVLGGDGGPFFPLAHSPNIFTCIVKQTSVTIASISGENTLICAHVHKIR